MHIWIGCKHFEYHCPYTKGYEQNSNKYDTKMARCSRHVCDDRIYSFFIFSLYICRYVNGTLIHLQYCQFVCFKICHFFYRRTSVCLLLGYILTLSHELYADFTYHFNFINCDFGCLEIRSDKVSNFLSAKS